MKLYRNIKKKMRENYQYPILSSTFPKFMSRPSTAKIIEGEGLPVYEEDEFSVEKFGRKQ
jgi:hypothetical protein